MSIREVMNGKAQACRKTTLQDLFARKKITDDLPEDVRMQKMIALFDCLAQSARMISDNFQSENMDTRMGEFNNAYNMANFMQLREKQQDALDLMQACRDEMEKSPLSKFNGTAVAFDDCVNRCKEESIRLEAGRKAFDTYLSKMGMTSKPVDALYTSDETCQQTVPAIQDKLVAKMMSFFSACMLLPDMIESAMV